MVSKILNEPLTNEPVLKNIHVFSETPLKNQNGNTEIISNMINLNLNEKASEKFEESSFFLNKLPDKFLFLNTQIENNNLFMSNHINQNVALNSSYDYSKNHLKKNLHSFPFFISCFQIKNSDFICKNCKHHNIQEQIQKSIIKISTQDDNSLPMLNKNVSKHSEFPQTNSKKNSIFCQCYHLLAWLEKSYKQRSHTIKKDIAKSIGESKKTMDDYLKCMRRGIAFNYDFAANRYETFGHLRNFLSRKEQSLGRDQFKIVFNIHKKEINIPEVINKIKEIIKDE